MFAEFWQKIHWKSALSLQKKRFTRLCAPTNSPCPMSLEMNFQKLRFNKLNIAWATTGRSCPQPCIWNLSAMETALVLRIIISGAEMLCLPF